MINVVNAFGTSFGGLSRYLMEGPKDNPNPERVAWTHTHNLGDTQDINVAWRIMADTSRRASELKRAAGFGGGGRKKKGDVLHYVLSWAKNENVTPEEMKRVALESLTVLGLALGLRHEAAAGSEPRLELRVREFVVVTTAADR